MLDLNIPALFCTSVKGQMFRMCSVCNILPDQPLVLLYKAVYKFIYMQRVIGECNECSTHLESFNMAHCSLEHSKQHLEICVCRVRLALH